MDSGDLHVRCRSVNVCASSRGDVIFYRPAKRGAIIPKDIENPGLVIAYVLELEIASWTTALVSGIGWLRLERMLPAVM